MPIQLYQMVPSTGGYLHKEVSVYKVRLWVLKEKKGGGFEDRPVENKEKIIFGNLDLAKAEYRTYKNTLHTWIQTGNYRGFAELYEADINDNGTLSGLPKHDKYIERSSSEYPKL